MREDMSGQVFRITELNPKLEMEIIGLLESEGLANRYCPGCDLYGIFDSDSSLAGIAGARMFKTECLLHFIAVRGPERGEGIGTALVSKVLANASITCSSVWLFSTPGAARYFERFGFESERSDKVPQRVRDSREVSGMEIASTKVMRLHLPDSWPSI
jgi:N-acetylglutamate synthase-like GNAT family acetyltransferase